MTPFEAAAQARQLRVIGTIPGPLADVIHHTVANPLASSDTLLILSDALRNLQDPRLTALADKIAALAPTRAPPIGDPAK